MIHGPFGRAYNSHHSKRVLWPVEAQPLNCTTGQRDALSFRLRSGASDGLTVLTMSHSQYRMVLDAVMAVTMAPTRTATGE